ncbi:MAG: hypothetical protein WD065_16955 [Planctomycetaceae bacterium]
MNGPDDFIVVKRDNQAVVIEVGLAENEVLECIGGECGCRTSAELRRMPQADELRRINVSEMSVLDHAAPPTS